MQHLPYSVHYITHKFSTQEHMTLQLAQTFWVNHNLDILLLSKCMYNIPTPSLMNYSLTKPQDGLVDNVHICPLTWKCHKLPLLHVTTKIYLAITKSLSFMYPSHIECNSNCSKATQTFKSLPLMYRDEQTLYRMRKCVKEEWHIRSEICIKSSWLKCPPLMMW